MTKTNAKRSQLGSHGDSLRKRAELPEKCRKCAMLAAEQAQVLHGVEGDRCWKPTVCYSRRSYARNRDRINQTRSRKRKEGALEQISVEFEPLAQLVFGVLVVYRQAGVDTPVHAIGAEIWQGQAKVAIVPPVHCADLCGQIAQCVGRAVRHQEVCQPNAVGPGIVCNPSLPVATLSAS